MSARPRLLIVSAVHPFPREAGQQQRVHYTLRALREQFYLTFLTVADTNQCVDVKTKLLEHCDEAIVLPSLYSHTSVSRLFHKIAGMVYA